MGDVGNLLVPGGPSAANEIAPPQKIDDDRYS